MKIYRTLVLPMKNRDEKIFFGIADQEDFEQIFTLRYKIYSKYNYLNESLFKEKRDRDSYDENGSSCHLIAKMGNRIVGYIRVIQNEILPIEKNFNFSVPLEIQKLDRLHIAELGRLVVDRYSDTEHFPRNVIMLFLIATIVDYCKERGILIAYSFLKKRLVKKLELLKLPHTLIEPSTLCYPPEGPMAPYFYNNEDPVFPSFFTLNEMEKFIQKIVGNTLMFKISNNTFTMKKNLYTKFLKTVGVI